MLFGNGVGGHTIPFNRTQSEVMEILYVSLGPTHIILLLCIFLYDIYEDRVRLDRDEWQKSVIGMPIYKFVGRQFYSCGVSENRRRDCTRTYNILYPFFLAASLHTSFPVSLLYLKRIASGLV